VANKGPRRGNIFENVASSCFVGIFAQNAIVGNGIFERRYLFIDKDRKLDQIHVFTCHIKSTKGDNNDDCKT
jgi:hypothetical protein